MQGGTQVITCTCIYISYAHADIICTYVCSECQGPLWFDLWDTSFWYQPCS